MPHISVLEQRIQFKLYVGICLFVTVKGHLLHTVMTAFLFSSLRTLALSASLGGVWRIICLSSFSSFLVSALSSGLFRTSFD